MWSNLIGGPPLPNSSPTHVSPQEYDDDDGGDGWEEDDDLDVEDSEHEDVAAYNQQPSAPHDSNSNGGMRKMFVGRLTRFLEQVTAPEEEEPPQNGWDEYGMLHPPNNGSLLAPHNDPEESENAWNDDNLSHQPIRITFYQLDA